MPNFGIADSSIVEFLRKDFNQAIIKGITCPVVGTQVIIHDNPQNINIIANTLNYPNFRVGNYYKVPNSGQMDSNNQPLPKYSGSFPLPFFAFVYPDTDANNGYMLIKSLSPLSNIPNDIIILNESQVLAELERIVSTIFAL